MKLFTQTLAEIRGGTIVDALTREFAALVREVNATGKGGKITLDLTIKPDQADPDMKEIEADIKVKMPRRKLPKALFFSDENGDLHRDNPRQKEMDLDGDGKVAVMR